MSAPRSTDAAARAWRQIVGLFMSTRHERDRALAPLGLTPNEARALHELHQREGQPMRALADAWGTDASNATWIVDRLERQGLAERRADPHDRRVKLVVLTPRGARTRAALMRAFQQPPAWFLDMDPADLDALNALFDRMFARLRAGRPGRGIGARNRP